MAYVGEISTLKDDPTFKVTSCVEICKGGGSMVLLAGLEFWAVVVIAAN